MRKFQIALLLLSLGLFSTNCARYKQMVIFPELMTESDSVVVNKFAMNVSDIKFQAGYRLNVSFIGLDQTQLAIISNTKTTSNFNEISLFIQSYIIDKNGEVTLPVIGKIKVVGQTVEEVKKTIQLKVNEYFKGVVVDIRLLNYEISIMGEVKAPSNYVFYKNKINLIEAITKTGGFSNYADITNVLVIREKDGFKESYVLDLTDEQVLTKKEFWLEPNDIIYVKPLRTKVLTINSPTISIVFSGLTTLLLFLTYFGK